MMQKKKANGKKLVGKKNRVSNLTVEGLKDNSEVICKS